MDYSDLFVSSDQDSNVHELVGGAPHAIVLENLLQQKSLLIPNYSLGRVSIKTCPLNAEVLLQFTGSQKLASCWESDEWATNVSTRFYIYPVHLSGAFLQARSLAASLYLILIHMIRRNYSNAAKLISVCFTDTKFSKEERWIMKCISNCADDQASCSTLA